MITPAYITATTCAMLATVPKSCLVSSMTRIAGSSRWPDPGESGRCPVPGGMGLRAGQQAFAAQGKTKTPILPGVVGCSSGPPVTRCTAMVCITGAEGGNRTRTGLTPLDFESSASASSATSATLLSYAIHGCGVKNLAAGSRGLKKGETVVSPHEVVSASPLTFGSTIICTGWRIRSNTEYCRIILA